MEFLFGIVGFILGSGLFYWRQQRQLVNLRERLERTQKALEQTDKLNRQQATQLQKFRQIKAQTEKLELYYQTRLQELEQSYQAPTQELAQSLKPSSEPAPLEKARQKTEAYWEENNDNGPASYLINPFTGKESEKPEKSQRNRRSKLDLAQFLEAKGDQSLSVGAQSELPRGGQEQPPQSELDSLEIPYSEPTKVAHLPEIPSNDSDDDNTLPEVFSDQESLSDEIEELLNLLELEGDSESHINEHKNGDHSEISD